MERDPVLGISSPGKCIPYHHIKGPWTGDSTLLLVNSSSCDRCREAIGGWCGESKDSRKGLGVSMNREVIINIWCNIVTHKISLTLWYTGCLQRGSALCAYKVTRLSLFCRSQPLVHPSRRPQTVWSTLSSEELRHWKPSREEPQGWVTGCEGWAMKGGPVAWNTE